MNEDISLTLFNALSPPVSMDVRLLLFFFFIKSCKTNVEWFGGKGFNGAKTNCGIVRI